MADPGVAVPVPGAAAHVGTGMCQAAAPRGVPGLSLLGMGCPYVDFGVFLGIGMVLLDKATLSGLTAAPKPFLRKWGGHLTLMHVLVSRNSGVGWGGIPHFPGINQVPPSETDLKLRAETASPRSTLAS